MSDNHKTLDDILQETRALEHRPRTEERRRKLAKWIDNRYPNACWTDLCGWAAGFLNWDEVEMSTRCQVKDESFVRCGGCYCGKHMLEREQA